MTNKQMTYAEAGVNIDNGDKAVELMKPHVKSTYRPEVVSGIGGFGGLFALDTKKFTDPVLVSGTDGVGTKLQVAFLTGIHDTIGIDCVAMCVNDILVSGAEPLFFLDYMALGRLEPEVVADVVKGVAEGCRQAGCALIGGETAEMPGFYKTDEYDVAGFCVGAVNRGDIIDGSTVKKGDLVIGLASTGLHSNGYSLARKVFFDMAGLKPEARLEGLEKPLGEALLTPTRIYVKDVLALMERHPHAVKAMAHITGGGLLENLPRSLPSDVDAELDPALWTRSALFDHLAALGNIAPHEMYRTFNMGVGFVLIVAPEDFDAVMATLAERGAQASGIGRITEGSGVVKIKGL